MNKFTLFNKPLFCLLLLLLGAVYQSKATMIVVAKDGTGNYGTVQAAIDNAPIATSAATADTIYIKDGKYKEKITVPSNKPFIVMIGQSVANTILTYDDGATTLVGGVALGTQNSASVTIAATDFTALNITFANTFGDGSQAVAVLVNNDRVAFRNCRFLGNQDTIYIKGSGTPKQYFRNCYIDGNVDFIFGSSIAAFDSCVIYGKVKPNATSTFLVAPNTPTGQAYGMVFRGCQITGNTTTGYYYLGRPWQANPKAVYLDAKVYNNMIQPTGWSSSSAGTATLADAYFAEHKSVIGNGPTLVDTTQRVSTSFQMTDSAAATYTLANMFGTWDPCAAVGCSAFTPTIAMANMKVVKGTYVSTINWNICWPITGVQYQLYRSSDSITYAPLTASTAITTSINDTTWNFQLTDSIPAQGNIYWYYVKATKTGYATNNSDTFKVSSAPTIITSGTLAAFTQYLGTASTSQNYSVSGTNLTTNVAITAPTNYQLSLNGTTYSTTLSLTPASGILAATPVYVRLNASALGTLTGNITHTSTSAVTVNIPVTGTTIAAPTVNSDTLEYWPLTVSNTDSTALRAPGVVATVPTFRNLYSSTATAAAVPAYSATFGQAFGASATADGAWGTAAGGPGGNLSRIYYEQFTVKAASGDSLRIDSLILTSAFYQTSSNTKLAVVYSKSNFVADSTEVAGATFAVPIALANQTAGPTSVYRMALNGTPVGIKTDTAGTLTIRLYFSCGSTSNGRYGMLKGVTVIGDVLPYIACIAPTLTATATNKTCTANGSVSLATTGGVTPFTYAWTGPNSYTSTSQNLTNLDTGNYQVTVTATGGCTATATAHVGRTLLTATVTALSATTFCQGDTLRLKANTGAGFSYSWKRDTTTISGASDSMYAATTGGNYTVTITNGTCTSTSVAIPVTVKARPATTVTPSGALTFCAGDSVTLKATTATGNTYQWKLNGATISNATDSAYTIRNSGNYSVRITNAGGCKDSSVATAVVANPRPVPVIAYSNGQLSTGAYTNYQWMLNGQTIASATTASFTPTANGSYTVRVDSNGCSGTSVAYSLTSLAIIDWISPGQVVQIFPNPATDKVQIQAATPVNVQLKDLQGRLIQSVINATTLDISAISEGVYFLTVSAPDGTLILTQRLLKVQR